ncbi:MAG: hypothetical protein P8Y13_03340 [Deinococcales bacterium]
MQSLPTQLLPAVPHVVFSVFDLALPNIVAWVLIDLALLFAAWFRLPAFLEATDEADA